jgi:hypothetical protein
MTFAKLFFIFFIILACFSPSALADIRADIEAAKKDVAKAEEMLEQRKVELETAAKALKPFNERIYQLEKEKKKLLEKLYAGDLTEAKKQRYEQAVKKYFSAAEAARPAEAAVMTAGSNHKAAEERLDKARQRLADLREQAVKGLGKEAPPYLVNVEAKSGGEIFYLARWGPEEEELGKKIKFIKEQMEEFRKRIGQLNGDIKEAMLSFKKSNLALQDATKEVVGALWSTFWYDAFADASVLAIKIMLDYREMGPWAFPYQAIEQTVAVFSDDEPSGPDLAVLYSQRSPAEDSVIFSRQFLNDRGVDVVQKFVSESVEAMLGGHAVMIADGDLHAALETHILNWDKAQAAETGFYNKIKNKLFPEEIKAHVTRMPKLKDIRFKDIEDAARRKVADPDWWKGRVGADLLKDAALEAARGMLPSTTWYFEREPAVRKYVAAQGACEIAYRWLRLFQNRRNIAQTGLEALQKKLAETLDELEKKRHNRKLEKGLDEEAGDSEITLELIFSSEMDNVEVRIDGNAVSGNINGKVWTGRYEIGGGDEGELSVLGIEKTSRKELDADPSTIPRIVSEGKSVEFKDWEKGSDRSHTLLFRPKVIFVKRAQFEMGGKIYYEAEWGSGHGAAERSLSKRIDQAINKNDLRDAMIRIWLSGTADRADLIFGAQDTELKPEYPSKFFSAKVKSDVIKKETALSEIPLLIRVMPGKDAPFDPDPKTVAQRDATAPGGWRGLEPDKTYDTSHKINVGKIEPPAAGKFKLEAIFTKADFEDILREFHPGLSGGSEGSKKLFYVGGGDAANRFKGILWFEGEDSWAGYEELQGRQWKSREELELIPPDAKYLHHLTGYRLLPVEITRLDTSEMYSLTTALECANGVIDKVEGSIFSFETGREKDRIEIDIYFGVLPDNLRVRVSALDLEGGHSSKVEGYPFFDEVYMTTLHADNSAIPPGQVLCAFKDHFLFVLSVYAPAYPEDAIRRKIIDRFAENIKIIVYFDPSQFPAPFNPFYSQASYGIVAPKGPWLAGPQLMKYSLDPASSWHSASQDFESTTAIAERIAKNFHRYPPEKQKELIDKIRSMPPEERKKLPDALRRLAE